MSDFKNEPPNDEWIRSIYRSDRSGEDELPESIDASILEQARLEQARLEKAATSRVQPYGWIYGTAASAILGIMLILQIPETDDLPSLLTKAENRQAHTSKVIAVSREKTLLEAKAVKTEKTEAEADVKINVPNAESIEEVVVYAQRFSLEAPDNSSGNLSDNPPNKSRTIRTEAFKETSPEKLSGQASAKAQDLLILPTPGEPVSTLTDSALSNCTRLSAYFTNAVKKQVIVQCETDTQLSFQFEDASVTSCNALFHFSIESAAIVSTRIRDPESELQEIQINYAGDLYSLRCDAKQWVLAVIEQP